MSGLVKVGVYASALYPGEMSGGDALDMALAVTRTAQRCGFDGVFVAEHHLLGPESMSLPPFPLLGRLAAEMPLGYLGTAVHLGAMSHPVQSAENAALLDVMTGGRFILGVGQGYRDVEFASLAVPKSERAPRLREGIAAMKALFAGDGASFDGEYYHFQDVSMRPLPTRIGGPPVWVGSDNPTTIARIPRYGDAWIASGRQSRGFIRSAVPDYRQTFDQLDKPYPGVPMFREVHVAHTRERARDQVGHLLSDMLQNYHRMGQPGENYNISTEDAATDRLVVGAPDDVAELLASYRDEFDVPFMWFRVYWPGMSLALVLETVQMLGESVLPLLR